MNCLIKAIKAGIIIFSIVNCGKELIPVGLIQELDRSLGQMQRVRDALANNPQLDTLAMDFLRQITTDLGRIAEGATDVFVPFEPELAPVVSFGLAPTMPALTAPAYTAEFGQEQQDAPTSVDDTATSRKARVLGYVPLNYQPTVTTRVARHTATSSPNTPSHSMSFWRSTDSLITTGSHQAFYAPCPPAPNFVDRGFVNSLPGTPPYPIQPPNYSAPHLGGLRREQTVYPLAPPKKTGLNPPLGLSFALQQGAPGNRLSAPPPPTRRLYF